MHLLPPILYKEIYMNKVYYMDGYHGGIRGHMPLGAWRDILDQMKKHPDWKLHIDVEPVSWDYLKERDPEAYEEFSAMLKDGRRMEMVSGSYGQPYGWITDGESNIRHLVMGRKITREHFPDVPVETYAVQEPCWTSALPQILRQMGYRRASLKNASTAWGGYCAPYTDENGGTAEVVDWTGPDGTSIPTIPRYACEDLVKVYETEACAAAPEWMEKCAQNNVPHPTGMYYQDLGWCAGPGARGEHIEFSLMRDYFENVTDTERPVWQPGQEIFRGALPWGDKTLVEMARRVRRLEVQMLESERLAAVSSLYGTENGEERLSEAWGHLLMTQHHDGWICAAAGFGENNWAWKTAAQVYAAEFLTDKLNRTSAGQITDSMKTDARENTETVVVFNPSARAEKRLVRAAMTAHQGTRSFEVYDGDKKIPCQAIANRKHGDGSWNAGEMLFLADLPALGVKTFTVCALQNEPDTEKKVSVAEEEGRIVLENSCVRIVVDASRGGVISSYYDKRRCCEIVPEGAAFNEFKGYFIEKECFCSNTESPAKVKIEYAGPLAAVAAVQGRIGSAAYTMRYTMQAEEAHLDVSVDFHFPEDTHIGEPYEMKKGKEEDPHRTYHDGRYRLNAYFPTLFEQKYIDKDCAYDVCRSKLDDTHFRTWHEIKHNILLHWADTTDGEQGLCVFADHTTAYIHGGESDFGLALAWGYDGGFWWGRRTLRGGHSLKYRILPHGGMWRDADLWHENEKFLHAPMACRCAFVPEQTERSIFACETDGVELGAFYTADGDYYVRVFNAGEDTEAVFRPDERFCGMTEVSPEGIETGRVLCGADGRFTDVIPPFGIRTYRLERK